MLYALISELSIQSYFLYTYLWIITGQMLAWLSLGIEISDECF